ncbi:MAG TPA: protein kinase [Gemmatimonadaceae bacterium]|nr:protein kinase [Gemmatimonadaceae bacterium]
MSGLGERLQRTLGEGYRVTEELGGGGMSRVFVAEETELGRSVVVKVLPPDVGAGLNVERFRREVQLAARLQHPHIVPLLSAAARDDLLFYTMPLIEGDTLRAKLARAGELPIAEAIRILRDIADALEYAHNHGVAHRDIKPENVLVSGHHALVTDFGVSKALSSATGEQSLTSIGIALGTPAYMSPEQATADPNTDHRTDIYALGVVGYELLAGRPPFSGHTPQQVLAAHVTEPPVPITKHRPNIPAALASLIMRCLEKKPADRWQTAEEIRIQLESLGTPSQGTQPVSARSLPVTPAAPVSRRKLAVFGGVAAALLLASLLASRYLGGGDSAAWAITSARQVTNDPGIEITPALSPDGSMLAYAAGSHLNTEVFVRQVAGGQPIRIGEGRGPRWFPDGSRIVFVSRQGIVSAPALGGQARVLVAHEPERGLPGFAFAPAVSHDGNWLAYGRGGAVHVAAADGSQSREVAKAREPYAIAWSRDDSRLAYATGNWPFVWSAEQFANIAPGGIWVVSRDGGDPSLVTDEVSLNTSPAWTADGQGLLYVSNSGGGRDVYYQRVDRNGRAAGSAQRLTTGLSVHGITVSDDGRSMAYSNLATNVGIWSLPVPASGEASLADARQITSATERIEAISVSADGQWLAFDSDRSGNAEIYKMRIDGTELQQVTNHPSDDFRPTWSPDGREITFHSWRSGDRDGYVIGADGSGEQLIAGGPLHQWAGRISPDGQHVAYFAQPRPGPPYNFVVPRSGGTPRQISSEPGGGVSWTPDGQAAYLSQGGVSVVPITGGAPRRLRLPGSAGQYFPLEIGGASSDGKALFVRIGSEGEPGLHIARVPLDGSPGSIVVRFDRPDRQALRAEFSTDGRNFYFTLGRHEADIWVVELQQR